MIIFKFSLPTWQDLELLVQLNSSVQALSGQLAPVVRHVAHTDWLSVGCVGAATDTHFHLSVQLSVPFVPDVPAL